MGDSENKQDGSLTRITEWAAHPFKGDMSALQWVLWLGLIIAASVMWWRLIAHFEAA